MPYAFNITDSETTRQVIVEKGDSIVVGGDPDCELGLSDPTVSRHHVLVDLTTDEPSVEDLHSTNGTWLDGYRVSAACRIPWPVGIELKVGETTIVWRRVDSVDAKPAIRVHTRITNPGRDSALSTLPLQNGSFWRQLPALLALAGRADTLALGRAIGEALVPDLKSRGLALVDVSESPPAVLFAHGETAVGDLPDQIVFRELQACTASADSETVRLLEMALRLLALALPALRSDKRWDGAELPTPVPVDERVIALFKSAARAAVSGLNIVIEGETGVGKEVVAKYFHTNSRTSDRPLLTINCAALSDSLLEAELFGIEKGTATGVAQRAGLFEQANGGVLFLDEIADMSAATQARILRVLEEGLVRRVGGSVSRPARVQIVAASNRSFDELLADGTFRRDLYHRLADWRSVVPPLRERPADIPNLTAYFLSIAAADMGKSIRGLSASALSVLQRHHWPGNVRELQREIQRAVAFAPDGAVITADDLAKHIRDNGVHQSMTLDVQLRAMEKQVLRRTLASCNGNVAAAAKLLGISRATWYRKADDLIDNVSHD